ncbi:Uncharacterised protein [Helicobacter mustelae]|nr:Uncharacterised protein [Helicobacter mustelae]STP12952.1 Uncharacterised protein [Helicobacter mustelae]STP14170.1 Uncharacterised protein [Helicobacter mustelae]
MMSATKADCVHQTLGVESLHICKVLCALHSHVTLHFRENTRIPPFIFKNLIIPAIKFHLIAREELRKELKEKSC